MKPLHYLIALFAIAALSQRISAQTFDCTQLSISGLYQDQTNSSEYWITVAYEGGTSDFINYPFISVITGPNGDTLATGNMFYFGQIGGTAQDYPVTLMPGASLDAFTAQFVLGTGDFVSVNDTCYLSFPPTQIQQHRCLSAETWSCWPNPAHDIVYLQVDAQHVGSSYEIRNALGQVVRAESIVLNAQTIQISDLPAGPYLLRLLDEPHTARVILVE